MEQIKSGITFVPRYVRQISDMDYGDVVTHENYNEKLNLNSSQGDYNTEILKLLLNVNDPEKTVHVPYLDKIITDEVNRLDDRFDGFQEQLDTHTGQISDINDRLVDARQSIVNIITGATKVGRSTIADNLSGVVTAGRHRYYGTDYDNNVGFHEVPDSIYAREFKDASEYIADIVFTPALDSVTEAMLVADVRTKLNRASITDYDELTSRPSINNVILTGNKTLADLNIQPAGNYITEIPTTYATKDYVTNAVAPKLDVTTAASTYATISALNALSAKVPDGLANVVNSYIRVGIGNAPSNPRTGDLWVTL